MGLCSNSAKSARASDSALQFEKHRRSICFFDGHVDDIPVEKAKAN